MPRRAPILVAVWFLTVLSWAGRLAFAPGPWRSDSALVMAAGLLTIGTVSVVGILVAAARWARRLAIGEAACLLLLAIAFEVDTWWVTGLVLAAFSLAMLVGPALRGTVRVLPSADGAPAEAVLLMLSLLATPTVVAAAAPDGLRTVDWVVIAASVIALVVYAKAWAGSLILVRAVFPLLLAVTGVFALPAGLVHLALAVLVATLAWRRGSRVAVRPLTTPGRAVPMFPEMVPPEILEAAGLDEKGRPIR